MEGNLTRVLDKEGMTTGTEYTVVLRPESAVLKDAGGLPCQNEYYDCLLLSGSANRFIALSRPQHIHLLLHWQVSSVEKNLLDFFNLSDYKSQSTVDTVLWPKFFAAAPC